MIKNNGPSNAAPINAYKEARAQPMLGSGLVLLNNGYFVIPGLASGATTTVTVSCAPPAGFVCKQATAMTLNNSYDPDYNNNVVTMD